MTAVLMIDQYVMCATVFIILFSLGIIAIVAQSIPDQRRYVDERTKE